MKKAPIYWIFIPLILISGCEKGFLEKKPDQSLLIPKSLDDMQALLDNQAVINLSPAIGLLSDDDIYTTQSALNGLTTPVERNAYVWAKDIYEDYQNVNDWNGPYTQVFYANVILKGLEANTEMDMERKDMIKGSALFVRSMAFYTLCQLFCKPYLPENLNEPGIVIKLNPEVGEKVYRSDIQTCYRQVVEDLKLAIPLLPVQAAAVSRPSRTAALTLMAKVELSMGLFDEALDFTNQALLLKPVLLDYNTLSTTSSRPFPVALPSSNSEVIWYSQLLSYSMLTKTSTYIDTLLYSSYHPNDLRKKLFFTDQKDGLSNFKGKYTGSVRFFGGMATDELYLMKAECIARSGDFGTAMNVLNSLLEKRFKKNTFVPLSASDKVQALSIILNERRKELIGRGTRWTDLRRLNNDVRFSKTLYRKLDKSYMLLPEDPKYVFPIPSSEIGNSGILQNAR